MKKPIPPKSPPPVETLRPRDLAKVSGAGVRLPGEIDYSGGGLNYP